MAHRYGDRNSRSLFPISIEEYVSKDDPVRVYDAFVENLDFKELGIVKREGRVGAPCYDPAAMLKLFVYGYSYGLRSARKLERACYHNVSFIWMVGGLKPDYKTISEFRRKNRKAIKKVLKQCARLCMKLGLIEGNILFLDSSKMRANASLGQFWTKERCEKYLKKLDEKIEKLLIECERIDKLEENCDSLVKVKEELLGKEKLQKKVKAVMKDLEETQLKSINSTDRDSVKSKSRQGSHASYNTAIVTDGKHGLIVNNDSLSQSNDTNQFSNQIEQAEEVLEKESDVACSDAGFWQVEDLKKISSRGTKVVVPSKKQASQKEIGEFEKENFKYDKESDEYICPEGKRLSFLRISKKNNCFEYRVKHAGECLNCKNYGVCTKSKRGRIIARLFNEDLKEELEKIYESEEGREIYKFRKQKVELPFGHIKRNLGAGYFLLRGREGVNAEMSLLSTSFNISRMITLLGVQFLLPMLLGT